MGNTQTPKLIFVFHTNIWSETFESNPRPQTRHSHTLPLRHIGNIWSHEERYALIDLKKKL